jgi:hypothetical protein
MIETYVKAGFAGYGPDLDTEDSGIPSDDVRAIADAVRWELDSEADALEQVAEIAGAAGDYETAWKSHQHAARLEGLRANLDHERRASAPLYVDDPAALDDALHRILTDRFPWGVDLDPDGRRRLYVWEAETEPDWVYHVPGVGHGATGSREGAFQIALDAANASGDEAMVQALCAWDASVVDGTAADPRAFRLGSFALEETGE